MDLPLNWSPVTFLWILSKIQFSQFYRAILHAFLFAARLCRNYHDLQLIYSFKNTRFLAVGTVTRIRTMDYGSPYSQIFLHLSTVIVWRKFAWVRSNETCSFCGNWSLREQQEKSTLFTPEKDNTTKKQSNSVTNWSIYVFKDISLASVTVKCTIALLHSMIIMWLLLRDRVFDANRLVNTSLGKLKFVIANDRYWLKECRMFSESLLRK